MTKEEIYHNEWISLYKIVAPEKKTKGYIYSHETRCKGMIVSILPYRKVLKEPITGKLLGISKNIAYGAYAYEYKYLLRSETTPCWNIEKHTLSTITGGVEGDDHIKSAVNELREEAGYEVFPNEMIYLGSSYGSKSSDTIYSLYSVDLTNREQGEALGDGSGLELEGKTVWVDRKDILECRDPLASVAFLRLEEHLTKHE